jgi:peptide-methionine (S)-S-oxide reductase
MYKIRSSVAMALATLLCVGSAAIASTSVPLPPPAVDAPPAAKPGTETAVFAGGCFWGVEAVYRHLSGVSKAVSGYAGGTTKNPTYAWVSMGTTGHAESVQVTYDPSKITYGQLLRVFFSVAHDPTQLNRQGPDVGDNYRSAIFAATPEQESLARAFIEEQSKAGKYKGRKIVTQIASAQGAPFYEAEDYHQDYHLKHGGSCPLPEP